MKNEPIVVRFDRLYLQNAEKIKTRLSPEQRFFDIKLLAECLGLSVNALRGWTWSRHIPHFKFFGLLRYDIEAIEGWVKCKSGS